MEIEKLATSAVERTIAKTDRLSSYISRGDKEPCWDGNIYIHEDKVHSKKNIKKVATQIKGKLVKSKSVKEDIKYQISYDDLYAYMMNGGTMFFVVYLDRETGDTIQIYYTQLLPIKIKNIIENKKKSYSVRFLKFPDKNTEKTELFLNFYENAKKQNSFAGETLPTIEELSEKGLLEGLTFHYTGIGDYHSHMDFPKMLDGKSVTLYAKIKGGTALIPIEYVESVHQVTMSGETRVPVSVKGKLYYDGYRDIITKDTVEWVIGTCVRIISPNVVDKDKPVPVSIKIHFEGMLEEQIKGIEFVSAIVEHGHISIGNYDIPVKFSKEELDRMGMADMPEILTGYQRVREFLKFMNVKTDLDIQKCTEEELVLLNMLIAAVEDKHLVKKYSGELGLRTYKIANINLAIVCLKNPNGSYSMRNYFGEHFDVTCQYNEGPTCISQFSTMSAEEFLTYDNLNLQMVVEDHKRIPMNEFVYENANNTLLEMIKAYDKNKTEELFSAIKQFSKWLYSHEEYGTEEVMLLNRLQIVLRERALTFSEKNELYKLIEKTESIMFKVGAFLLLDEQEEAKSIFKQFENDQRETFEKFPIYKFYRAKNL